MEYSKTVALIDGDAAIRDSLGLLIEAQGWVALPFADGDHFFQGISEYEPDCLILEPHQSGMSGLEIVTVLNHRGAEFPIIGLTAWPTSRLTTDFSKSSITELLIKPVRADELIGVLLVAMRETSEKRTSSRYGFPQ